MKFLADSEENSLKFKTISKAVAPANPDAKTDKLNREIESVAKSRKEPVQHVYVIKIRMGTSY